MAKASPESRNYAARHAACERAVMVLEAQGEQDPALIAALRDFVEATRPADKLPNKKYAVATREQRLVSLRRMVIQHPFKSAVYYAERLGIAVEEVNTCLWELELTGQLEAFNHPTWAQRVSAPQPLTESP